MPPVKLAGEDVLAATVEVFSSDLFPLIAFVSMDRVVSLNWRDYAKVSGVVCPRIHASAWVRGWYGHELNI